MNDAPLRSASTATAAAPEQAQPPSPAACLTMADVRSGVDAVDRALVALMTTRQGYMDAAARIKTDRSKVHDAERIEAVVAKVCAAARASGLSTAIAEPMWRLLIDRCIAYELDAWDRTHAGG